MRQEPSSRCRCAGHAHRIVPCTGLDDPGESPGQQRSYPWRRATFPTAFTNSSGSSSASAACKYSMITWSSSRTSALSDGVKAALLMPFLGHKECIRKETNLVSPDILCGAQPTPWATAYAFARGRRRRPAAGATPETGRQPDAARWGSSGGGVTKPCRPHRGSCRTRGGARSCPAGRTRTARPG